MNKVIGIVLIGLLLLVAMACGSGISQEDHDAAVEAARDEGFAEGEASEGRGDGTRIYGSCSVGRVGH